MKNRTSMPIVVAGAIVALALVVLGILQGPAFAAADTTAPSVAFTAPSSGAAIRNGQALTAAASDAGGIASVAFRYCAGTTCAWTSGRAIGTATTAPYTVSWSAQPGDGSYALLARATDKAGNVATTAAIAVTVDNTAPATTIVTRPPLVAPTASAIFTFSSEAKATFQCSLDNAAFSVCASPKSYTGLASGWHSFRVRAVDRAGNVDASPETAYWYVNVATDTTPPDTTITAQPPALTSATGATFSFSSEAGATFACSLDGAAFGTCTSSKSYSAITDGTHTFAVRATDAAGNTDPTPATASWTVDTVAPDTAIGAHPSSPTNSTTATLTFSSEAGAKFACKLDAADYASCTSPKDLSALSEGTHTFSVRATDAAGNTDATPASSTWTVDTTAPNTTLDSHPSSLTNVASASFTFSSEAGARFACKLDAAAYTSCNSPTGLSGLKDGSHTFSVRATDAAGNTDETPASFDWTVDATAPDVVFTETPTKLTNQTQAHLDFSSETGATVECSLDGEEFYTCQPPENVATPENRVHTFAVRETDEAGNRGSATFSWTVDTIAPDVVIDEHPSAATSSKDGRFVFSSEAHATFECSTDNVSFSACTSPFDLTNLADGEYTFSVRATDETGNRGDAATSRWTVDTAAPETTIGSHPDALATATDARFTFSSSEDATFECKLDVGAFERCTSPDILGGLADGSHTFTVQATDAAGNTDGSPATVSWTVDAAPPTVSITSPEANATVSGVVSFAADVSDANGIGGVQFKVDNTALGAEDTGLAPYGMSWDTTAASNGQHTLTVESRDTAGNVTTTSIDVTVSNVQATTTTPGLIAVGPGYVDATARQVVRTSDNRAYIIAVDDSAFKTNSGSAMIRAWKADTTGVPTAFAEVDATNEPHPGASGITNIVGIDLRLDRATGIVHTVRAESGGGGTLVYQTFDTNTNRWSSTDEDVVSGVAAVGRGRGTFALAVDAAGNPHVVYVKDGTLYHVERVDGSWSSPVALGTGGALLHPSMSFDSDGNLHVAWLDESIPAVQYNELHAGSWGAAETVATGDVLTNINADQGVSVAANTAGLPYVLYLSGSRGTFGSSGARFGAVQIRYRSADGSWQSDDPAPELLAHTPQLYLHGDDVYAFLGHDIDGHLAYAVHQAGHPWSAITLLSGDGDGFLDGAASVRFDVADQYPGVIDSVFYNEDKLHDTSGLPQLYYRAVTPATPPAPDTTAPSVSIDAPAADATVTGAVSVSAQASDDVGVTSVQFQLDGADLGRADSTAPYSVNWDTAAATNSLHVLTAIARDAAGHETISAAVTVSVLNSAPPASLVTLLGSEVIGGNSDYNDEGVAEAFQVTATESGSLRNLQVYLAGDSAATSVLVGVYSDNGNDEPGTLLTTSALVLPVTGWNAVSMPVLPIESGTKYWIALLAPTGAGRVTFRDTPSGGPAVVDSTAGDALPSTWTTTDRWSNAPLSAFGTT